MKEIKEILKGLLKGFICVFIILAVKNYVIIKYKYGSAYKVGAVIETLDGYISKEQILNDPKRYKLVWDTERQRVYVDYDSIKKINDDGRYKTLHSKYINVSQKSDRIAVIDTDIRYDMVKIGNIAVRENYKCNFDFSGNFKRFVEGDTKEFIQYEPKEENFNIELVANAVYFIGEKDIYDEEVLKKAIQMIEAARAQG